MSEVSKSVCSNSAASFLCTARRRRAMVAALAGLSLLASPIHGHSPPHWSPKSEICLF